MVIALPSRRKRLGAMTTDLVVAVSILTLAAMPLAYSIHSERILARTCYERAVAMEIVDGEMEILVAGGWRAFGPGTHAYTVPAEAVQNLPEGAFELTITANSIRLLWTPAEKHHGGVVVREAHLP